MGQWRGPRTANDPLLTTHHWRTTIRRHWQAKRLPCARCHKPIDYTGPRYLIVRGRRRVNPRALVVGHIVSRYDARRLGWTDVQINALTNSQPECVDCSNRSGAKLGQQVQRQRAKVTSLRW